MHSNRAAIAKENRIIDYVNDDAHYRLTDEQIAGVHHAMGQADRGEYATDTQVKEIFGRSL